jgi:hypothetical protein
VVPADGRHQQRNAAAVLGEASPARRNLAIHGPALLAVSGKFPVTPESRK